jgi:hypothetical protein
MSYLDDRYPINGRIVLMTLPAVAFFIMRLNGSMHPDSTTFDGVAPVIDAMVWISPLFLLLQIWKIWEGTASSTWQNFLCAVLTAAAAAVQWSSKLA